MTILVAILAAVCAGGCGRSRSQAAAAPQVPPVEFVSQWGMGGNDPGQLSDPVGPATDRAGRVYVAERGRGSLEKFMANGVPLLSFIDSSVRSASALGVDHGGGIYVADARAGLMHIFFPEGDPLHSFHFAAQAQVPAGFAFGIDEQGTAYVPDTAGSRIECFNSRGQLQKTWPLAAASPGQPARPAIALAAADGSVYVGDGRTGAVAKYSADGQPLGVFGDFSGPPPPLVGLAASPQYLFVLRAAAPRLEVWSLDGHPKLTDNLGGRLGAGAPGAGIAVTPQGDLIVLDPKGRACCGFACISIVRETTMTLVLKEDDIRNLLDMPAAVAAVEESFRRQASGDATLLPRRRLELPERTFLNDMAAADRKGPWMGAKLYSVARGAAHFAVVLFRGDTGEVAALIEGDYLGQLRTGAATGVATRYLSREDSRVLGMIGTGLQARTQLAAVKEVRKLELVRAYSRTAERAAAFCQSMSEQLGVRVVPAATAEEAVRGADIVITATNSLKPVVQGSWFSPGTHVNAMGANMAKRCELDAEAVNRAALVAVDSIEQSKVESGDLIQAWGEDASKWERVCELAQIIGGKLPGRKNATDVTLFKSNGIAIWDLAVAAEAFERAKKRGIGQQIQFG